MGNDPKLFATTQWIAWMSALAIGAAALTSFAYSTFTPRLEHQESKRDVVNRLDRIENKLDRLLEQRETKHGQR